MGRFDLAAAAVALERATELEPDDAETFADLGLVRMAQGDVAAAEQALKRSIQLKPDYAEAHQLREQLAKAKGNREAVKEAGMARLKSVFDRG
jgi:cytochrome c-type biogenesis protein CcmH/NrfG